MTTYITDYVTNRLAHASFYQVLRSPLQAIGEETLMTESLDVRLTDVFNWEHQQAVIFLLDHRPWYSGGPCRLQHHHYDQAQPWEHGLITHLPSVRQGARPYFTWLECLPCQTALPRMAILDNLATMVLNSPLVLQESVEGQHILIPHGHLAMGPLPPLPQVYQEVPIHQQWRNTTWITTRQLLLSITTQSPSYLPPIFLSQQEQDTLTDSDTDVSSEDSEDQEDLGLDDPPPPASDLLQQHQQPPASQPELSPAHQCTIGYINIRGEAKKRLQIEATMQRYQLHGLGIGETHIQDSGWIWSPSMQTYQHGAPGAAGISLHWNQQTSQIPVLSTTSSYSLVMAIHQGEKISFYFHIIYAPPQLAKTYLDQLKQNIADLSHKSPPNIFMGDFNIRNLHEDAAFSTFLHHHGYRFVPLNTSWTWQQSTHDQYPAQSYIDYIIAPLSLTVTKAIATIDHPIYTDHKLLTLTFQQSTPAYEVIGSSVPKLYETQPDPADLQTFVDEHSKWSQHWQPSTTLPMTEWMQKTLELCVQYLGPGMGRKYRPRRNLWHWLMRKKSEWASKVGAQKHKREVHQPAANQQERTIDTIRQKIKKRKGSLFAPISEINDAQGNTITGKEAMQEFVRQMELKQSPPAPAAPLASTPCPPSHAGINTNPLELQKAIGKRHLAAPGMRSMTAQLFKAFLPPSLAKLTEVINTSTMLQFIEPILRFLLHLPMRKRVRAYTEADYRPIILEEELAKIITVIIHSRLADPFRHTSQSAYQKGRSTLEVRKMAVMFANHALEHQTDLFIYKRDKVNAFGSIDQAQIATSLSRMGIDAGSSQWFQMYVSQAIIISVTHYGTTRGWKFLKGVFQGDALGPIVYIAQNQAYMDAVAPHLISTPILTQSDHLITTVQEEQYSDDLELLATQETTLLHNLQILDDYAPQYGIVYDLLKEHYLAVSHGHHGWRTQSLTDQPYSAAKRHHLKQGFKMVGTQIWPLAPPHIVQHQFNQAFDNWNGTTYGLKSLPLLAQAYQEHVQSAVAYHCFTNAPSDKELHHYDQQINIAIRQKLHLTPRSSATNLRRILLHMKPPIRSFYDTAYRALLHSQLDSLNHERRDLSDWAIHRWQNAHLTNPLSDEQRLIQALAPKGLQLLLLSPTHQHYSPAITYTIMQFDTFSWTLHFNAPFKIYTDASARTTSTTTPAKYQTNKPVGTGAAIILQASDGTIWKYLFPLPWGMDNVKAELIALTGAYRISHLIHLLGGQVDFVTTDSQVSIDLHQTNEFDIDDPLHRKCVQAAAQPTPPTYWVKGHQTPLPHGVWQAEHILGNILADTAAGEAADLSAQGALTILPQDLGNIWLLYDPITPSFINRHLLHWDEPPWTSDTPPPLRLQAFLQHDPEHQGILYPLYAQNWMARGLWRDEKYLPYCCTTLDVGTRHQCPCQLKIWYAVLQPRLTHQWRTFYTEYSINLSHTSRHPEAAFWWTIGPKDVANYDWSFTPWNFTLPLPPHELRAIWTEVVQDYRQYHHR